MRFRFYSDTNQSMFQETLDTAGVSYAVEGYYDVLVDDTSDWVKDQATWLGGEEIEDAVDL